MTINGLGFTTPASPGLGLREQCARSISGGMLKRLGPVTTSSKSDTNGILVLLTLFRYVVNLQIRMPGSVFQVIHRFQEYHGLGL